jgi:hypothetical protein
MKAPKLHTHVPSRLETKEQNRTGMTKQTFPSEAVQPDQWVPANVSGGEPATPCPKNWARWITLRITTNPGQVVPLLIGPRTCTKARPGSHRGLAPRQPASECRQPRRMWARMPNLGVSICWLPVSIRTSIFLPVSSQSFPVFPLSPCAGAGMSSSAMLQRADEAALSRASLAEADVVGVGVGNYKPSGSITLPLNANVSSRRSFPSSGRP